MFAVRYLAALAAVTLITALAARADEGHKGPNGGVLFAGAKHKFHIELKVDPATRTATAYILDGKAKKAVPIKAKTIEVKIKGVASPVPLEGVPAKDKSGAFTQFRGKHDRFADKLDFATVEIVARVVEDKPAFTFHLED